MRAYSPSCGVRMLGPLRSAEQRAGVGGAPSALRASASITSGTGTAAITNLMASAAAVSVLSPGPITTALHLAVAFTNSSAQSRAGRCMRTASVGHAAAGSPGEPSLIMPAPAAIAPRVHKMAAPSMPAEPAATPTAVVHLLT